MDYYIAFIATRVFLFVLFVGTIVLLYKAYLWELEGDPDD